MDEFLYNLQMTLSYALALSQIAVYIFVAVFFARVGGPATKALKAYIASKNDCTCGRIETPAQPAPAIENPKAQ